MDIQNVLFDLDGTLLDTTEGIMESIDYTIKTLGYGQLSRETLLKFIGPPIQNSFIEHYSCDAKNAQRAADVFREYYRKEALIKAKPYNGIYELCSKLFRCGKTLAVATYKREDYALILLKNFGLDKYCKVVHGADNNNRLKKSDIITKCVEELGGVRHNCVYIGDTVSDALESRRAGVSFIGVTYGFGFSSKTDLNMYECIGIADAPMDILGILTRREIR